MDKLKIEKELKEFKLFKENYNFIQKEIIEINGIEYCDNEPLVNDEGEKLGEGTCFINVGYKNKGAYAKVLSNLFPYKFEFRGKNLSSIESFFQGIKFKDIEVQNYIFDYSGLDSNNIKVCNDYNWIDSGILFFQGIKINRFSREYEDIVDELYISAIQNPLYRNALKNCDKYILHSIGKKEKNETVFTRFEFEKELNCLKDFLKIEDSNL